MFGYLLVFTTGIQMNQFVLITVFQFQGFLYASKLVFFLKPFYMNVAFPALLAQSSLIFMVELKQKIEDAYNCSFLNCWKILSKSMNLLNK